MPYQPPRGQPDFSRLRVALLNSGLSATNQPLHQCIDLLIQWLELVQTDVNDNIAAAGTDISGLVAIITDLLAVTFLTSTDQTTLLVNSRQLLAGTNITFDDLTPGERTINSSGGSGGAYVPVGTGAEPLTFVSDGAGQAILVPYTP